ncbi:MAG: hypothetical protein AUK03_04750 [Anaerolineae bacterium CG2_30_64_16]|nr:MAG: hypothetical protein AUK03_04750 [Anaerolineae bacterium CG2_30_64_16]
MSDYGVILAHTTSAALRAEKVLKRAGLTVKLIPTPREFSSDCGMAVRFDWAQSALAQEALAAVGVEMAGVYRMR